MKVGIIGLGPMGLHHAGVVKAFDFVQEVRGCDLSEAARGAASKRGVASVESISELLAWKPDAVLAITQATAHTVAIEPCLRAGVPVLTEKPMATTIADCRKLVALAARKKTPFQVGFELRYCGLTRAMQDVVKSGVVGKPLGMSLVQISGPHGGGHMARKRVGGIFWEKLCHQVELYRFWLGEPRRIWACTGKNALNHYDIPDNVLACMDFGDGKLGRITFMTTRAAQVGGTSDHDDRGHFYELTLTCTKGSLTFCAWTETLNVVRFNHREDQKNELVERFEVKGRYGEPCYDLTSQDGDFLRRVRDGKKLLHPASDALETMEWVARAEKSLLAGGKWVTV